MKLFAPACSFCSLAKSALAYTSIPLLLAGCFGGNQPAFRYYTLDQAPQLLTVSESDSAAKAIQFKLLPISVPERLNSNSVVLRESNGELRPLQTHLWAAELPFEIAAAISNQLQATVGARDVSNVVPDRRLPVYRLRFTIQQFDIQIGNTVSLFSNWSISGGGRKTPAMSCQTRSTAAIGETITDAVAGQQILLAEQARVLASSLSQYHRDPSSSCP